MKSALKIQICFEMIMFVVRFLKRIGKSVSKNNKLSKLAQNLS